MISFTIDLPQDEADRLVDLARFEGATPEAIVRDAVRARLDRDGGWVAEVQAGLGELEAGGAMTLKVFEREMDDFMRAVRN